MGARGPAPTPTALKKLRGNPGKRALNKNEPTPTAAIPSCPAHLGKEAKREWRRIAKELYALELLSEIDRAALAAYCQNWQRWVVAEKELAKKDAQMVMVTEKGYHHPNPWIGISNQAQKQMKGFLEQFGMTPASRSRVPGKGGEDNADPYADFLAGAMSRHEG